MAQCPELRLLIHIGLQLRGFLFSVQLWWTTLTTEIKTDQRASEGEQKYFLHIHISIIRQSTYKGIPSCCSRPHELFARESLRLVSISLLFNA